MSDSKPLSPLGKAPPLPQTKSHSRSLTPRQEYSPSPPHHLPDGNRSREISPLGEERYRSRSHDRSPPRKYPRRSHGDSRSPSLDRDDRQQRLSRYDRDSRYNRDDRYHRFDRYDRDERSARYDHPDRYDCYSFSDRYGRDDRDNRDDPYDRYGRSDRRDMYRDSYPDRDARSRYYSPERRSPPPRYREYSRDYQRNRPEERYRRRYLEDVPREHDYPNRRSRMSDRSSSRSPRRRRERRRRDRRRRDREPVSPSQRIPAEEVDQIFLEALKLVVKYRPPPFNISVISDYMSSINQNWSVRKTQYPTFSDLCRVQESRGHLVLARQGESVVMQSSKYQPDKLEVKPKDLGKRKRIRDRDRGQDRDSHIDAADRREWDLRERVEARKERFRVEANEEDTRKEDMFDEDKPTKADQDAQKETGGDANDENATLEIPEKVEKQEDYSGLREGGTDASDRKATGESKDSIISKESTPPKTEQGESAQSHPSPKSADLEEDNPHAGKTEK